MSDFNRKNKEEMPVLAICYDFDKTLSPTDMQAQGYIQEVYSDDIASFWKESNLMAEKNNMDENLAYMFKMVEESEGKIVLTRDSLREYGSRVELFPGVEKWFQRIAEYGNNKGIKIEHYIISSGLKEMIEGTSVAKEGSFEEIYASSFLYNERNVPIWPAQVINYTNKTQFLFRIEKGILNVNDKRVNDKFGEDEYRVPFTNMIYIGDSDTDIPCMKLVNKNGGYSIGVYNENNLDKSKVFKMMTDDRIKYFAPANYRENSKLDKLVKTIIDHIVTSEQLKVEHCICKNEVRIFRKQIDQNKLKRLNAIGKLQESGSFRNTHACIREMSDIEDWDNEDCELLFNIATSNSQVKYVLSDNDVKDFYSHILDKYKESNELTRNIEKLMNQK